jgi:hypothetical protein
MPGFRLADILVVLAAAVLALVIHRTFRWVAADPSPAPIDDAEAPGTNTRMFRNVGWFLAAMLWWANAMLAQDAFFRAPGELKTLAKWHGLPWPVLVGLVALVSPLWLLLLTVGRAVNPCVLRRVLLVVVALVVVGYPVFWAFLLLT